VTVYQTLTISVCQFTC